MPGNATVLKSLLVVCLGFVAYASSALAQEAVGFSNASLKGTYTSTTNTAGPNEPRHNFANAVVINYDGTGNFKIVFLITNRSGEPDAEGKPTRNLQRHLSDPSTWRYGIGEYEVSPWGTFIYRSDSGNVLDCIVTKSEMIDGVLTIVEYELFNRNASGANKGGVVVWIGRRVADADLLPAAPE